MFKIILKFNLPYLLFLSTYSKIFLSSVNHLVCLIHERGLKIDQNWTWAQFDFLAAYIKYQRINQEKFSKDNLFKPTTSFQFF